jgi:hypothetical protein
MKTLPDSERAIKGYKCRLCDEKIHPRCVVRVPVGYADDSSMSQLVAKPYYFYYAPGDEICCYMHSRCASNVVLAVAGGRANKGLIVELGRSAMKALFLWFRVHVAADGPMIDVEKEVCIALGGRKLRVSLNIEDNDAK